MSDFIVRPVKESRAADTAWRRLASFQDVDRSTQKLMSERQIPLRQIDNVRKQLHQVAFSIAQAREFFESAEKSGAPTRALMAYYGLTSLANAEILWRGDGSVSFDRRKGRFNSHGFKLKAAARIWDYSATCTTDADGISGLFSLWRVYASHIPQYGKSTMTHDDGGQHWRIRPMSTVTALSEIGMPSTPLTLGRCLQCIPAMRSALDGQEEGSILARGAISEDLRSDVAGAYAQRRSFIFHQLTQAQIDDVCGRFLVHPSAVSELEIKPIGGGMIVNWMPHKDLSREKPPLNTPEIFSGSDSELFFIGEGDFLNEFGFYYVALYIAGMITRYYPHIWIKELRTNSLMSSLVDELVEHAVGRVPLLSASALERAIFIYE